MSYYGTTINDSAVIVVKAGEEISAPAFLAVGADGKVATAGKNAIGIVLPGCDDKVAVGDDLDVQIKDIGAWTAGAAVAKSFIVGIALEESTKAGQRIAVQIVKAGYKPAE